MDVITEIRSFPKKKPIRLTGKKYKDLQIAVLERDNFMCQKVVEIYEERVRFKMLKFRRRCGKHTEQAPHHIVYRSRSGSDTMKNLISLCLDCHEKEHR